MLNGVELELWMGTYAVSVMDGHSIMLEKWNNVQYDFGRKTPLGIIKKKKKKKKKKNTEIKIFTEIKTRLT